MSDRRVSRTKNAIKKAFMESMKMKSLGKITVKEITSMADIGRGTFYLQTLIIKLGEVEADNIQTKVEK